MLDGSSSNLTVWSREAEAFYCSLTTKLSCRIQVTAVHGQQGKGFKIGEDFRKGLFLSKALENFLQNDPNEDNILHV
ncbi:MAG: hypothetical protein NPIRA04_26960 [Nitrospirales bacterium]|nr:MAG: hypothetical protein NPIRA04_26960 [Nitrospirales bacterium]